MKQLVIGYEDTLGQGSIVFAIGPDEPAKKHAEVMTAAEERHEFPKRVKRLELYNLDKPVIVAEFISNEVAGFKQKSHAKRQSDLKIQHERNAAERLSQDNVKTARKIYQTAANERNRVVAAMAALRKPFAEAAANDPKKSDMQKQIEAFEPQVKAAVEKFEAVRKQYEIINNPKTKPEDFKAAFEKIST